MSFSGVAAVKTGAYISPRGVACNGIGLSLSHCLLCLCLAFLAHGI